jgi:hypothetical protein
MLPHKNVMVCSVHVLNNSKNSGDDTDSMSDTIDDRNSNIEAFITNSDIVYVGSNSDRK